MSDPFTQVFGPERGKISNLGDDMNQERLRRVGQAALEGNLIAAHNLWRRDNSLSPEEKKDLREKLIEGSLNRASDELDMMIYWRRVFVGTGLWNEKTALLKFGRGAILHLAPDGQETLCGASEHLHNGYRGSWASPSRNWSHCQDCLQQIDLVGEDLNQTIKEGRALVPLSFEEAEVFKQELIERTDFQASGELWQEMLRHMQAMLRQCLAAKLKEDPEQTLAICQQQMIRTAKVDIRKRVWQLYGVRDWNNISGTVLDQASAYMLSEQGVHQNLWSGLCYALSLENGPHSLGDEIKRSLITPLIIRPTRAERKDRRSLRQEIRERRRAGW